MFSLNLLIMHNNFKKFLIKHIYNKYNKETISYYSRYRNIEIFQFYTLLYDFAYSEIKDYIYDSYNIDMSEELDDILKKWIRDNYLNGNMPLPEDEIVLIKMYDDPHPIKPGTKGIVLGYSYVKLFNEEHIDVAWENGRTLKLIVGVDDYRKI